MDVKAMARSKRSHTKQHQPRKPHRPTTTHSATSSSSLSSKDPKVLKKEGEKKRSNPGNSLPSNIDRYYDSDEDDADFGMDSELSDAAKTDVVKPKSKGADFAFLKSQALSQSPANFTDSIDSILSEFTQGLGSMPVFGENILSWAGGVLMMEDEATSNSEVPFISLNLQTNAEDFARISFAKRLFIEECFSISEEHDRDVEMTVSTSVEQSSVVDDLIPGSSKVERKIVASREAELDNKIPRFDTKAAEAELDLLLDSFDESTKFGDNKIPRFNAKAAEAELDLLLDSFEESKFVDSSSDRDKDVSSAVTTNRTSASLFPIGKSLISGAPSNKSGHLEFSRSANNLDNDIDDLLQETANFAVSSLTEVNAESISKQSSFVSGPGTKSKEMEEFDSWLDSF